MKKRKKTAIQERKHTEIFLQNENRFARLIQEASAKYSDELKIEWSKEKVGCCWLGPNLHFYSQGKKHRPESVCSCDSETCQFPANSGLCYPPAVICKTKLEWWTGGVLHSLGGPAVFRANGAVEFWINGKKYPEQEYWRQPEVIMNSSEFRNLLEYKNT